MEKQRSFSIKKTKFFIFSLTISISIIFLTLFSIWVYKSDPFIINQETHFHLSQIGSFSNLSQTHFTKPLNIDGFEKKLNLDDAHDSLSVNSTKDFSGSEKKSNFDDTHEVFGVNSTKDFNGSEKKSKFDDTHEGFGVNSTKDFDGYEKKSNLGVNSTKILDFEQKFGVNGESRVKNYVNVSTNGLGMKGIISEGVHTVEGENVCDVTNGKWIYDEGYKLYTSGTCSFIDEGFNCEGNGRLDKGYMNWRWKPHDCDIPRFNATNMLELIRGKRLVFVGDSINRNQWESMLCLLMSAVKDPRRVYETHGRRITKDKGNYSFKFLDYKCTVEYYVSHFLVHEGKARVGRKRMQTLRIDTVDRGSSRWRGADVLIFNTAHWWNHYKTKSGVNYYQEADNVLPHLDSSTAFTKSMTTWASWVDKNINPRRTQVIFRSSAPSHFKGGEWNAGGHCKEATQPLNQTRTTNNSPEKNLILQRIIKQMKTPVKFLNITTLSDYRIDGHPSIYGRRKGSPLKGEDCSHWCLPGVPDVWNQILYVHLQSNVKNRCIQ